MEPTYKFEETVIIDTDNKVYFHNNDIIIIAYYMPEEWQSNGEFNVKHAIVIVRVIGSKNDVYRKKYDLSKIYGVICKLKAKRAML